MCDPGPGVGRPLRPGQSATDLSLGQALAQTGSARLMDREQVVRPRPVCPGVVGLNPLEPPPQTSQVGARHGERGGTSLILLRQRGNGRRLTVFRMCERGTLVVASCSPGHADGEQPWFGAPSVHYHVGQSADCFR